MGGSPEYRGEIIIKEKRCKDCKDWKPIAEFYLSGIRKDGLGMNYQPYCKICDETRSRNLRRLKPEFDRRKSCARREYGKTFSKLTRLQKEAMLYRRLHIKEGRFNVEEIRDLSYLISKGSFNTASLILFGKK